MIAGEIFVSAWVDTDDYEIDAIEAVDRNGNGVTLSHFQWFEAEKLLLGPEAGSIH